ncbi:hypothetical protein HKBW3S03_00468 [Candidatus Hakubella thermalkaliphila]|uniref:Uncharacterized protein n=1 Tax=Candidatus Hakubella thermalkaliphila TaxID=2754717 RepID=A0A6V8NHW8_9ACTN|nr:hypothetical protein [Candidatus Hakubella thermalkaliphila]MBT9170474.1 hypothetical protein [Actinomycetota bacterium]GFP18964.1 hypothetical protein HKBW3S03_00468 [Candidatus Hakubella thermalkaliphila]GFP20958.1 hypothetical protein HKBW3S06_00185 [Candidatus Hakubella thermalkaliphila]GFP29466.1 hypothetical protein HKBW3S34_00386 [Candidatus Hakubella thermalkaliphila]GFP41127.1 hypothetical protein HKBW3C_00253 [Candidatus Hakubella thermalkaliphila]
MTKREKLSWLIDAYEDNVRYLEGSIYDEILSLFIYRDSIQGLLPEVGTPQDRKRVTKTDEELRQKRDIVVEMDLASMRDSVPNPPKSHWWWYLDEITKKERATA